MSKAFVLLVVAVCIAGCVTPTTYLKNSQTGQVVQCGGGTAGSWLAGMVGYSIEKNNDDDCVASYKASGFIPFYPGYSSTPEQNTTTEPATKPAT